MRSRIAGSQVAVAVAAALVVSAAYAHHSFAPHFDASKPVSISGTVTEFEARNPHSYVHIDAVDENGKTHEYVCESHGVTQLTRNGITPEMLKAGTKLRVRARCRATARTCASSTASSSRTARSSASTGRRAPRGPRPRGDARKDIFGTWLLAPIAEPQHERPAADDAVPDAGRRESRRGLRSVQGRPDVPLRSRRDPPRLGRARHAARDRSRRQRHRAASRVDGRAPRHPHEHEGASEGRPARVARPLDRSHGRRHARDRDRELLRGRAEPVRRDSRASRPRACCTPPRSRPSSGCISTRRASGSSWRSISPTRSSSRSRSTARRRSTRRRI